MGVTDIISSIGDIATAVVAFFSCYGFVVNHKQIKKQSKIIEQQQQREEKKMKIEEEKLDLERKKIDYEQGELDLKGFRDWLYSAIISKQQDNHGKNGNLYLNIIFNREGKIQYVGDMVDDGLNIAKSMTKKHPAYKALREIYDKEKKNEVEYVKQ